MKILVTAANGHTGFLTAKELLHLGFEVRAMVRNANKKTAQELKKLGAEIFIGDMDDYRDYQKALKGVRRAYFCAPLGRNSLFKTVAFITAAEEAQLEHVVYMSQWLLMQDHHAINTKENWLADQVVKMHKTVNYTFVIPGIFAFGYFFTIQMVAQLGIMPTYVNSEGLNAPPSEEDQGRVIAHILKDPKKHIGKAYRPTGPKIISQRDAADVFEKILKRKVKIKYVSERMLLKSFKAGGYNIYDYSNIRYYLKDMEHNVFAIGAPTNVVKDITGKEPEGFETIARRYIANIPEAKQSFRNKLKAIFHFIKIGFTSPPNMLAYEKQQNFPRFMNGMKHARDSEIWMSLHSNYSKEIEQ